MPSVIWSPTALADIDRLYQFLTPKSPLAAQKAIQTIRTSIKNLAQNPQLGPPVEGMDVEYRKYIIPYGQSGYVALYHYDGSRAVILAIRHQLEANFTVE